MSIARSFSLAAVAVLALCGSASAAITTTTITSPAEGALVGPIAAGSGGQYDMTVSGTSDGGVGDSVDIACWYTNTAGAVTHADIAFGIDVAADGSFTTSTAEGDVPSYFPCLLRAVPEGTSPSGAQLDPYHAVRIRSYTQKNYLDSGRQFDFYDEFGSPRSYSDYLGAGSCGVDDVDAYAAVPADGSAQQITPITFSCNGYYPATIQPSNPGPFRSAIQIDGRDAFVPYRAHSIRASDPWAPFAVSRTYDPATGNYTMDETDGLSECPANVTSTSTTSSNCSALSATDVTLHRVTKLSHSGLVIEQTDVWSTTGSAKSMDLYDEQFFVPNANENGYEFPGQSALATHNTARETIPISDPGKPASMLYTFDTTQGDAITNPRGSISLWPVPDKAEFTNANGNAFWFHYAFTIPANGSYTIRKAYATELSNAALAPLTSYGEDLVAGPSVSISSPADGATVSAPDLTVSGTASDNAGVSSVTVNGAAATLGPGTFSKDITLSEGANTITVVASDAAGNTTTATRTVTYTKPVVTTPAPTPTPTPTPPGISPNGTVSCPEGGAVCTASGRWVSRKALAAARKSHRVVVATWRATIQPGASAKAKATPTKAGRKLLRKRSVPVTRTITARAGTGTPVTASAKVTLHRIRKKKH